MKVTDDMVAKAAAVVPAMTAGGIRQILEAALSDQVVMVTGKGLVVEDGKSKYPDYMQIEVSDVYVALDLAQQLISVVQQQPGATSLDRPAVLLLYGEAGFSYDN